MWDDWAAIEAAQRQAREDDEARRERDRVDHDERLRNRALALIVTEPPEDAAATPFEAPERPSAPPAQSWDRPATWGRGNEWRGVPPPPIDRARALRTWLALLEEMTGDDR